MNKPILLDLFCGASYTEHLGRQLLAHIGSGVAV